jgi:hypothetical protein
MPVSPLSLQKIIDEAEILVPNSINLQQKIKFLNELNVYFFEVVKIPKIAYFNTVANVSTVVIPGVQIALRNIDRVMVGTSIYKSLQLDDVPPGNYGFVFDEPGTLTLDPAPVSVVKGYVRYLQSATTTFSDTGTPPLTGLFPEAPEAYHELFVLGLSEKIAKAQDDVAKANNYGGDFRAKLSIAQQNYMRSPTQQ